MKHLMIIAAFGLFVMPASAKDGCWREKGNWVNGPVWSCPLVESHQGNSDAQIQEVPQEPEVIVF